MFKKQDGISIIELIIVMSIIAVLAAVAAPQYGRFIAKSRVQRAATDLLQNMRLARTMAIKENREYLITFNIPMNSYSIGFDGDGNGSLLDAADGYENGPVRKVDLQDEYGENVVLGTTNFVLVPPNGPDGVAIKNTNSLQFLPDGTVSPGSSYVYLQHRGAERAYTFCVELVNSTVKLNLHMWRGDADNPGETEWLEIR
ncbi:MAG: prepilin-type N-terminal cleavage/methylation domain-containing protein [Deferribacteres bacterium]|nr:prepilin-type N-terminal cleavage/methylation domain-containing protein [Deferribacteres bacterium]